MVSVDRVWSQLTGSGPSLVVQGDNNDQGQDSLKLMTSLAGLVQHPSMPELALKASQVSGLGRIHGPPSGASYPSPPPMSGAHAPPHPL